jgi:Skp family chaperone for outer membrane proteins
MKVATVDVQQLISESKAGKSVQKQLVAEREAIQAEAASIEQSLQAEQKKLMEERAKLSPEDFSKKQVDFEKNLLEARSKLQNRGRALDKSANDTFNELRKHITDIVYTMATDQKIDLVLTRQNVVAAAKSIDITAEVMKALDKKVPDLKVKAEGKAPSKG